MDRDDGVGHGHALRADLVDLDDVGRGVAPVRDHGGGQHLRIGALADSRDLDLVLALVEPLHQRLDGLARLSLLGVPERDLGPGLRVVRPAKQGNHGNGGRAEDAIGQLHGRVSFRKSWIACRFCATTLAAAVCSNCWSHFDSIASLVAISAMRS